MKIYLTIDNIRSYFNFSNNLGTLNMIFTNDDQQNKYHQVWKEILKNINRGHGELKFYMKKLGYLKMIYLQNAFLKYLQ